MTRPPLIRTRTAAGRLWTLMGDRWVSDDGHLHVYIRDIGGVRCWSPSRRQEPPVFALADACEIEADAYREAVARMQREIAARTNPKGPDVILPRWSPPASVLALWGVAGVAWFLVCAGIVGWAL